MKHIRTPEDSEFEFVELPPGWDVQRLDREPIPMFWRLALAFLFTGGALVIFGALLMLLYVQTTPVTYVSQVHRSNIQSVAKAPDTD